MNRGVNLEFLTEPLGAVLENENVGKIWAVFSFVKTATLPMKQFAHVERHVQKRTIVCLRTSHLQLHKLTPKPEYHMFVHYIPYVQSNFAKMLLFVRQL